MTFGDKLSKLRKEKNLTQEQLAEILGVSRQSVSKWESDTAYPETEKLISLANLFECSTDYLLKDNYEKQIGVSKSVAQRPANHQRIIGYILLTVSLIAAVLILLLAKDEESLLLTLIMSVTLLVCSFICLFVNQKAGYWCVWAGFAPIILLSPNVIGLNSLLRTNLLLLIFYAVMFFVAKRIFNVDVITSRKKSRLIILGWSLLVVLMIATHAPLLFFEISLSVLINPIFYLQIDLIFYIVIALLLTYTVCYMKNLKK